VTIATQLIRFFYRTCLFEAGYSSNQHIMFNWGIKFWRKVMRYKLLVLFICLGLCGAAAADTVQAIINGKVYGLCATGIDKTFRAQPEVKSVDVDLENKLVTIHTREGRTIGDSKIRELLGSAGYSVTGIVRKKMINLRTIAIRVCKMSGLRPWRRVADNPATLVSRARSADSSARGPAPWD
jgi:hypothetical protein